jgi:hypothetical protein
LKHALGLALLLCAAPGALAADALPFAPGERIRMKLSYAGLRAGTATISVEDDGAALRFVAEARSHGFFAWLFRFRVDDRTVAVWDPEAGCSLGITKRLREGRAQRDQVVVFRAGEGVAEVDDPKIPERRFEVDPCALDVLSALYVTRLRGVPEQGRLELPVFDNGRKYTLGVRHLGRERLHLPPPLGRRLPTVVVEPQLVEGTGLFVKKGRLKIWLTDDAHRIPVRMRSKVAIGSVSADLEAYQPGASGEAAARP